MSFNLITEILNHPANKTNRLGAILRALKWQCYKRLTGNFQDVDFHGMKLRCFPDSHSASRAIYFKDYPDYQEMKFICDYLREGDTFIDVGANVGLYTILALSCVGPKGFVHSFEANSKTASRLRASLELNQVTNAVIHCVALSDEIGTLSFNTTDDDCTAHVQPSNRMESNVGQINATRLDNHLSNERFAMIKLDIEGYEPFALRGAVDFLRVGNPPVLQVEMAGYSKRYGVSTSAFIRELKDIGYQTMVYCPEFKTLEKTDEPWKIPVENVLAVCIEKEQFVIDRLSH